MKNNIALAFLFAKRDFYERYVGTGLGQFWYILSPIVMIFIYTVIFSDFMKMKLDIIDNSYAYSIYLIAGLLAWTTFSTIMIRLSSSFFDKAHLLKKISVPMYTFQLSILMTEAFLFCIAICIALLFLVIVNQPITWNFLWLLPVMFMQVVFAFGIGVILSLFTPFFKDLKEVIPIGLQLWFWMTPIIYLSSMIENKYPFLLIYNPFYYFVKIYQDIFLFGISPGIDLLFIIFSWTTVTLFVAAILYKKMIVTLKDII